ncbi:hypothetical protein QNI16_07190 [Cytophagaceae bacterium YF14B1]|uniref:Uncharacterized protein n=1 Tax=Xanthocytophaga flava TaxID=3048013 RepID=A0AAE3QPD4_9BACT|nr:hypothetical protein [Xanthocytophaga flavus]MDJ1480263.1 hypothetical protein [Xanthocytophaga flavus]
MKENDVIVSIRVLPYVKKYLEKLYPAEQKITQNDDLGRQITLMLETTYSDVSDSVYRIGTSSVFDKETAALLEQNLSHSKYSKFMSRYTERWTFKIHKSKQRHFTDYTTVRFNNLIDAQMKRRFYDHVDLLRTMLFFKQEQAVYHFMDSYGFTDQDINFRTLLKAYQRYELDKLGVERKKDLKKEGKIRQAA